jgi:RHS repeat-associated protein
VTETVPPVGVAANNLNASSCPASYPSGYGTRLASDSTTYTVDALGHNTQMTTPAPTGQSGSEVTTYGYDGAGNLVTTTAPPATNNGHTQVTVDTYNSAGELASETTGSGTASAATVSYCYDPSGDRTSVVYADGNTSGVAPCEINSPWVVDKNSYPTQAQYQTTSSYDSADELVSTTAPATSAAPNGATAASNYDAAGNVLTRTDPNGITTTWTYTPFNQPATITYSGSSAHSVTYGYDANGQQTAMADASGSSSYIYDPFSELTSATNGAGQTTSYGYNPDAMVASITYPLPPSATWATSSTVSYTYDNADILTAVTDFNGHQAAIGNTADGLPNSLGLGSSGDTITSTYDNTDSPSAISLTSGTNTLQSFSYTDSPAGTILNETDTPNSSQSPAVYSYDAKGRVTSMTPGTNPTLNYGFDASSNLTTLPTGATGSYDAAGEVTSANQSGSTTNFTYNADGQRLTAKQGSTTIASGTWNGAGQLTSYSDSNANMTAATYDGNGERATAITASSTQQFVWDTVRQIPQLLMDSTNAYIYVSGLAPTEQINLATGTIVYLITDSLGSVRGSVSSSGALTGTTGYDAWGNPQSSGGLSASTPFGYAGGYTDPTGLLYLLNRYYDPQNGQFLSVDADVAQSLAPYGYAGADPVSYVDPTGMDHCKWSIGRIRRYDSFGNWVQLFSLNVYWCWNGRKVTSEHFYAHGYDTTEIQIDGWRYQGLLSRKGFYMDRAHKYYWISVEGNFEDCVGIGPLSQCLFSWTPTINAMLEYWGYVAWQYNR